MIICICRAKTDRDVAEAIEAGAASIRDLQRCGIGTDCGSCHNVLRVMLAEAVAADAVIPTHAEPESLPAAALT